jgi:hypothetical protein
MPNGNPGIKNGPGEIKANPGFINLDCADYGLKSDSKAVDAGINIGYALDFANKPVFVGKATDIGAFENQGE